MHEINTIDKEISKILSNVRKFRELRNLTREQLAADLGLSASGYSKIERGEIELTISRLYQIASALEVTVQQILEFDVSHVLGSGNGNREGMQVLSHPKSFQDDLVVKYIQKMEEENQRLRAELGNAGISGP